LSDTQIDIQINGDSSYDQIEIDGSGDIDIDGATVNLSGNYTPQAGDVFIIFNKISGTFANLTNGGTVVFNNTVLDITYSDGNELTLTFLAPLPVELIAFNGYAEERSNLLKWQTASEENTMVFIVERSLDGANDFSEIDRVNAVGNSTTLQSYTSEDFNPVSLAYYRLRIVDFDGSFEYSDIIVVERSKPDIDLVEVFPNPAEDEVTVLLHVQIGSKAILTLSDFMGRKIKQEKVVLKSGINRFTLNWDEHETNFFYFTIDNGEERIARKILRASKD
jgi:hypothetical protein